MSESGYGGEHIPDLAEVGVEEVEPGICEDSYENRRKIRFAKWWYEQVEDEDGSPTGLIRVFDELAQTERRMMYYEQRKYILTDPANPWSDYLDAMDMPADAGVPTWVKGAIRKRVIQMSEGVDEERWVPLPGRCDTVRIDGTRCWNWGKDISGVHRCKAHLSYKQEVDVLKLNAARLRIVQAAPAAVNALEQLMETAAGEAVRLKAATELLDRAGIRGGTEITSEVTVTVADPGAIVRERLAQLANNAKAAAELEARIRAEEAANIIEGSVVEPS